MTNRKYQVGLNDMPPLVGALAEIGRAGYGFERALGRCVNEIAERTYDYSVRAVSDEIRSWIATSDSRERTIRNAICIIATQLALM